MLISSSDMRPNQIIKRYTDEARVLTRVSKPVLVIMMGIPGCGKSTLARHLAEALPAQRIASDDIKLMLYAHSSYNISRIFAIHEAAIAAVATLGCHVISDANSAKQEHRQRLIKIAEQHKLQAVTLHCTAPLSILEQRMLDRKDKFVSTIADLNRYHNELELPAQVCELHTDKYSEQDILGQVVDYIQTF